MQQKSVEQIDTIKTYAVEFFEKFIDYLPTLLAAIIILFVGWWFIKFMLRYIEKLFIKKEVDLAIQKFSLTIINWGLKILLFVIVISQLGIQTASLLAILGAAGLAVGLALQGSLSNFAGGIIIIALKPFKLGDWVQINDISGSVKDISLFYTKLNTFGNQVAIIPNGELSNNNIINYSAENTRRDAITIGVSYDSDIKLAKDILLKLVLEQDNILKDPAPQILVSELADSSVNLSVRFFATNDVFWDAHWFTIEESKTRLEAAGISLPFPQRDVHLFSENGK